MEANHDSGDRLPSEQVLAQRFGVNRHTVRRAIDELVLMGLIERRHGKGIFVLEKPSSLQNCTPTEIDLSSTTLALDLPCRVMRARSIASAMVDHTALSELTSIPIPQQLPWDARGPLALVEAIYQPGSRPLGVVSFWCWGDYAEAGHVNYQYGNLLHQLPSSLGQKLRKQSLSITAQLTGEALAHLLLTSTHIPCVQLNVIYTSANQSDGILAVAVLRGDKVSMKHAYKEQSQSRVSAKVAPSVSLSVIS